MKTIIQSLLIITAILFLASCSNLPINQRNTENAVTPDTTQRMIQNATQQHKAALDNAKLAIDLLKHHDYSQAHQLALQARELAPHNVLVNIAQADDAITTQHLSQAKQILQTSLIYHPSNADLLTQYAHLLCQLSLFQHAQREFTHASALPSNPHPSTTALLAGQCALRAHQHTLALTDFTQAIDDNPSNQSALFALAELNYQDQRYRQALYWLNRPALKANSHATRLKIQVLEKLNRFRQAAALALVSS